MMGTSFMKRMPLMLAKRNINYRPFTTILQDHQQSNKSKSLFKPVDEFHNRHLGPDKDDTSMMLQDIGHTKLNKLISEIIPKVILFTSQYHNLNGLNHEGLTEPQLLERAKELAKQNLIFRSFIGQGYVNTQMPNVIQRNILENPGWYTQYTPYQAEISQGRLESLFNFQTMVSDMTMLPISNSSLLDEATAAAEAMSLAFSMGKKKHKFLVDISCHTQTIEVIQTRAEGLGIEVDLKDVLKANIGDDVFGVLFQYPNTYGEVNEFEGLVNQVHDKGGLAICATDLLALTKLKAPGEFGCDIAIGNTQRFGVPIGFGGPHAAFFACTKELQRKVPGRIVGLSRDREGNPAYRLALQTREQHIKREKATSNICTSQALLANIAAMYAVYHGPKGLKNIANMVHGFTKTLRLALEELGYKIWNKNYFDTLVIECDASTIIGKAESMGMNFRLIDEANVGITLDETTTKSDLDKIIEVFNNTDSSINIENFTFQETNSVIPDTLQRQSQYLQHEVFNKYHTETNMLRYIFKLQKKDLSLVDSMIPLGSCTMKLNGTTEMIPISWPEFNSLHPFAPLNQSVGLRCLIGELETDLAKITGFDKVTVQPNSGAQGEYTGLKMIKKFHESNGEPNRKICFIPISAHGTNPASAAIAGLKIVTINCDTKTGNIDLDDLKLKTELYGQNLASIMITYPSTYGVFEPKIREVINLVHQNGGLVYLDGANMNALIGFTSPGFLEADVCHLNLHKTFCIPHGGGGPGVGPIGVKKFLEPYLPQHRAFTNLRNEDSIGPVSAAPFGSASILAVSWAYIKLMGLKGLRKSTATALLNANYLCTKLSPHYPMLYLNSKGRCAHEFIIDLRPFKESAGIEVQDVAKRLIDYGFHSPTMSWPIPNTLMIEPTESESKMELDRFVEAMIAIRKEIAHIEDDTYTKTDNPLKNAPHTAQTLLTDSWNASYKREVGAFPTDCVRENKFWPSVSRVDDLFGDRNLISKRT